MSTFDLAGKRFLVTGGAGLIGSHITDLLVCEGAREIVVLGTINGRRKKGVKAPRPRNR